MVRGRPNTYANIINDVNLLFSNYDLHLLLIKRLCPQSSLFLL